jgi:hypothetical protein
MKYYEEYISLEDRQLYAYSEALEASTGAYNLGSRDDLTTGFIKSHSDADP